ncbi:ABC transporter permease [Phytohabitans sp. ZYX-F-186]|uniref:ABC transporter permease n=1 Tax=Phytohabitans maris TaxID=3071409 RepID=A0ABU0ZFD7_9ACTN|nr:ABC transporter permease [Phytohabitans sp. ZYX-F-186]MDQ7905755.1 ABC transporter permease [Phytohabitans sp. ZYX-F-186]
MTLSAGTRDDQVQAPHDGAPPPAGRSRRTTAWPLELVERFGLVLLLGGIVVFFCLWPATSDVFPTVANVRNIAANESILVIAALAALIPLVAERFDLSVGAIVATTSIATAKIATEWELPLVLAIAGGVLVGAAIGLVNGFLIAYFNANSLVITLGMSTLLAGIGVLWTGYQTLLGVPQPLLDFGNLSWLGIPRPVWLLAATALAVAFLLGFTMFGRRLLAIGSNEPASRLVGMPVSRTVMLAFACSGAVAGVAGVLLLARTGSAAAGVGTGYTLPALAAIFLGSTTIRPGRFTVAGTLVGVFFVAVSINGLTLAGAEDWVEPVFNGAAVVLAVSAAAVIAKKRKRAAR